MPEVPGPVVQHSGRGGPKCRAKGVVTEQLACHTHIFGRAQLHELAGEAMRLREGLLGRLPPHIPPSKIEEHAVAHEPVVPPDLSGDDRTAFARLHQVR